MKRRIDLWAPRAARVVWILLGAIVAGCATQPLTAIKPGGPLAIVGARGPYPDHVAVVPARRVMGESATAGGIGGMAVGAALSLACGPLAPACLPATP